MSQVYVEDVGSHDGQAVTIKGWLYNKRSSGKLHFLLIRDGTGVIQCVVVKSAVPAEQFALADHVTQESAVVVCGTVRADARAPGGYELSVTDLQVVHTAAEYPITPKEHGVAFLLDHRHLWLRSARQHAILRVRSAVIRACRDYFDGKGFTLLDEVAVALGEAAVLKPLIVFNGRSDGIVANHRRNLDAYITEARQKIYSIREELEK